MHDPRRLFPVVALCLTFFCAGCHVAEVPPFSAPEDATIDSSDAFIWGEDVWRVTLPPVQAKTSAIGWSEAVAFTVPEGTTALQIQLASPAGHVLQLAELVAPDAALVPGNWLKSADQPWLYLGGQERARASAWQAAFLVPNAPQIAVTPGAWRLLAFAFDYDPQTEARQPTATTLDVQIDLLHKPDIAAGAIDLNLCLTGARGITAATAPDHPRVRDALQVVEQAWGPAGIHVGTVRYFDVPAKALSVTHDDGADSQLAALLRLTAGQPPGLPIFLLESVDLQTSSGLVPAAGFTAGLPTPFAMGGPRTGIALALKYDAPDILGVVMAHEIGHCLGLFHVVEAHAQGETAIEDRLPDTAPTPDNLMYYAPDPARLQLTAQQAAVALGGPWVRP